VQRAKSGQRRDSALGRREGGLDQTEQDGVHRSIASSIRAVVKSLGRSSDIRANELDQPLGQLRLPSDDGVALVRSAAYVGEHPALLLVELDEQLL
jgi:hypothetical protein